MMYSDVHCIEVISALALVMSPMRVGSLGLSNISYIIICK